MTTIPRAYAGVFQPLEKLPATPRGHKQTLKEAVVINDAALVHRNNVCGTVTCIFERLTEQLKDARKK